MNKPEPPETFGPAQGLLGRVLRTARESGENLWKRATDAPTEEAQRRRVLMMFGGGVFAIIAVLFVLSRLGGDGAARTDVDTAQAVSVFAAESQVFQPTVSLNGEARPVRDIQVVAPATGVRILQLLVDEGDTVRQGQPMARLDTNLAQAQTRAAQASVAEAESAAVRARGEYECAGIDPRPGALHRSD
ncbi:MAG: efflux RND transporter periplasmic adaptor subunit [Hyphomonadaceae bacterium]